MKTINTFLLVLVITASVQAQTLRITGSNTFGEKLGPLLVAGFERKYPGSEVTLQRPGSGEGISALINGKTDIAPASRPANRAELQAAKKAGVKLIPQSIGGYGVAVIVNAANPVKNLKPAQVRALFNGRTGNWSKVRGNNQPVNIYILGKNTGARAGFQELALRGDDYAASAKALPDYASIAKAVAADPNAIGYADMGLLPDGVRSLLINGEPANGAAIYERVYPYANMLYLYTLERKASPIARQFVRYVLSKEGQRIMQKAGFVPRLAAPPSTSSNLAP